MTPAPQTTISRNGFEVAPLSSRTAKALWLARATRDATNVKTPIEWRASRSQYGTRATSALAIATKAAREHGMAYILHCDDKVSRVMIDWKGRVCVSSAYPG